MDRLKELAEAIQTQSAATLARLDAQDLRVERERTARWRRFWIGIAVVAAAVVLVAAVVVWEHNRTRHEIERFDQRIGQLEQGMADGQRDNRAAICPLVIGLAAALADDQLQGIPALARYAADVDASIARLGCAPQ